MVTNSYLGEYVVDINTPLVFFQKKKIIYICIIFLNEDNLVTGHTKTPSSLFLFLFLLQLVRDGEIIYLNSSHACPWEPWSFFTSL